MCRDTVLYLKLIKYPKFLLLHQIYNKFYQVYLKIFFFLYSQLFVKFYDPKLTKNYKISKEYSNILIILISPNFNTPCEVSFLLTGYRKDVLRRCRFKIQAAVEHSPVLAVRPTDFQQQQQRQLPQQMAANGQGER